MLITVTPRVVKELLSSMLLLTVSSDSGPEPVEHCFNISNETSDKYMKGAFYIYHVCHVTTFYCKALNESI